MSVDEATVIRGALEMSSKCVADIMTPYDDVFVVSYDDVVDEKLMKRLIRKGHSRVPVYRQDLQNIVGLLLVKELILLSPADATPIADLKLRQVPRVAENMSLYDLLNLFQLGKSHLALVLSSADCTTLLGVVTLEGVIESLIMEDIADETDERLASAQPPFPSSRASINSAASSPAGAGRQIHLTDSGGPKDSVEAIRSAISATAGSEKQPLLPGNDKRV